jgi:lipopolysaccharide/colanic/teichoic acid biosynthesis glycosyltransferase
MKVPKIRSPLQNRMTAKLKVARWKIAGKSKHVIKRFIDITVVLPALLCLSPLFIIVAALIKLHDRGPVLFWQPRVGKDGVIFAFPKFRSMVVNSEAIRAKLLAENQHGQSGVTFKMKRDPRITPIGRFIRRFSIDELPQLWCVLTGEMSLVGPRPPIISEVEKYTMKDRSRLSVTPGLTSIWAVSGRSEIPFPQQVDMDIEYIQQQSAFNDIKLLLKTVPAVLKGKGAY